MDVMIDKAQSLLWEKLVTWFEVMVTMLPNFAVAILILLVFVGIGRLARRVMRAILHRTIDAEAIVNAGAAATYYLVLATGAFLSLSALNLDRTVTSLLAGAGVVGLALSFAFQDLATNFVSGMILTLQRPLVRGDLVNTNGFTGTVHQIGLRSVIIRDLDGQDVLVPSKDVFQNPLTNFSATPQRRVTLEVGVSYASDLERVAEIVRTTIEGLDVVLPERGVTVHWMGFGDSSINVAARFWIKDCSQGANEGARSRALVLVKRAFDREGIMIPFPIRTLDFGIRGGQTLTEALDAAKVQARTPG